MRADAYRVLGLCPGATDEEIRSAYRTLARRLHPDASRDPETAQAFGAATAAYDELRRSRGDAGEPIPVRRAPTPRTAAEPLRAPRGHAGWWTMASRVEAEPLRPLAPRGEPLRGPGSARARPGGPIAASRWRGVDLQSLLWLLGADRLDD